MDLNQFVQWQAAGPGRSVSIDIQSRMYPNNQENEIKIWAYNSELGEGQFVQSVEEIDIEAKLKVKELAKLAELSKKYGGA